VSRSHRVKPGPRPKISRRDRRSKPGAASARGVGNRHAFRAVE
jgi:hypothetical protein